MTLYAIIPVLNEAANIPRLLQAFHELDDSFVRQYPLHIVLVDDGSSDSTAEAIRKHQKNLNVDVLIHPQNLGPGAAFATAFEHLSPTIQPNDWIVTMEGDNTSRHGLLQQMLTRTNEGYDVVLASPYMYGGGIIKTSSLRVLLSHMGNLFVKEMLGIHGILTMSSFFRLYRGQTILKLQEIYGKRILDRAGFECMIELLIKLMQIDARISEVPMVLDTSRRMGKSKMKLLKTIWGYFELWYHKQKWMIPPD